MRYLALAVAAYLLGSLPSAYLVVRFAKGPDLRTVESGSVGALNAFRATGLGWVGVVWRRLGSQPTARLVLQPL